MSAWSRTEPIERLGHDDVELRRHGVLDQRLQAAAQHRGAGLGAVDIGLDELVAVALEPLAAKPHLVLDRGVALPIGGEAGIDRGAAHDIAPLWDPRFSRSLRG